MARFASAAEPRLAVVTGRPILVIGALAWARGVAWPGQDGRLRGLAGKRVLISGGSSGIGLAAAKRFLEEGSPVFISGLVPAGGGRGLAGLQTLARSSGMACDVSL